MSIVFGRIKGVRCFSREVCFLGFVGRFVVSLYVTKFGGFAVGLVCATQGVLSIRHLHHVVICCKLSNFI